MHETVHRALPTDGVARLRLENTAGTVRVEGWAKSAIDIVAVKDGYNAAELHAIAIAVNRSGNTLRVATHYSAGFHTGGVSYRIFVPVRTSVQISNDAGSVDVAGLAGDLSVETEAGRITADLGRVALNRAIALRATTGSIRCSLAPGSDVAIEARSTVGSISSDFPGVATRRESIVGMTGQGRLRNGSARLSLTTTTGAIALQER